MSSKSLSGELTLDQLEKTFGVFFVGYVVSMILYGFTFFQTYVYFSRYYNDLLVYKLAATSLCIIDTINSALVSQSLYYYLVTMFPFPIGLNFFTPTFCAENGLTVIAIYIVQLLYANRLRQFSKNYVLAGVIALVSTVAFLLGIVMTVHMFQDKLLSHLTVPAVKTVVAACQGFTFLSSVLTVGALLYDLHGKKTEVKSIPEGWFDKLVVYTIASGTAATILQLLYFIVFVSLPSKQYWMPFQLVASKMYINSIFTVLNSREVVGGQSVHEDQSFVSSFRKAGISYTSRSQTTSDGVRINISDSKPGGINIEVSRVIQRDTGFKLESPDDDGSTTLYSDSDRKRSIIIISQEAQSL